MTRSFVFVDQTFSSLTVHDRLHFVIYELKTNYSPWH